MIFQVWVQSLTEDDFKDPQSCIPHITFPNPGLRRLPGPQRPGHGDLQPCDAIAPHKVQYALPRT